MKSLFNKETSSEFISRINMLNEATPAQWGKMKVHQMLAHCQKPLEVASGTLIPKSNALIKFLFGKAAKKSLINDPGFKRNLPTFAEARITNTKGFEDEKQRLIVMIENFQVKGHPGLTKMNHPLFGQMSPGEWDILQVKHLEHHLTQFGV